MIKKTEMNCQASKLVQLIHLSLSFFSEGRLKALHVGKILLLSQVIVKLAICPSQTATVLVY